MVTSFFEGFASQDFQVSFCLFLRTCKQCRTTDIFVSRVEKWRVEHRRLSLYGTRQMTNGIVGARENLSSVATAQRQSVLNVNVLHHSPLHFRLRSQKKSSRAEEFKKYKIWTVSSSYTRVSNALCGLSIIIGPQMWRWVKKHYNRIHPLWQLRAQAIQW